MSVCLLVLRQFLFDGSGYSELLVTSGSLTCPLDVVIGGTADIVSIYVKLLDGYGPTVLTPTPAFFYKGSDRKE